MSNITSPPAPAMVTDSLFTLLLLLTALLLSLTVIAATLTTYTTAYLSAPADILTYIDTVNSSIPENESCDRDIEKLAHKDDRQRLEHLLYDIRHTGDNLREEVNRLLIDGSGRRLRSSARFFWVVKKGRLEDLQKKQDMLRTRFLVVYLGLVASRISMDGAAGSKERDSEKLDRERNIPKMALRPSLPHALTEGITKKPPPLRRLTTQAMGHSNESVGSAPRIGWAGVIQELQRSPLMHKRHASIETASMRPD